MTNETRRELIQHTVRLANNMLTEVVSNHAEVLCDNERERLKEALGLLAAQMSSRPKK